MLMQVWETTKEKSLVEQVENSSGQVERAALSGNLNSMKGN